MNFTESVENLKLEQVQFTNYKQFYDIIRNLKKLKNLELEGCKLESPWYVRKLNFPKLKSVSLKEC